MYNVKLFLSFILIWLGASLIYFKAWDWACLYFQYRKPGIAFVLVVWLNPAVAFIALRAPSILAVEKIFKRRFGIRRNA